jgi:hypothetical protein
MCRLGVTPSVTRVRSGAVPARRAAFGMPSGPVPNVVETLETYGILVIRLPLDTADVDASSLPFDDRSVVVLGTDKNDRPDPGSTALTNSGISSFTAARSGVSKRQTTAHRHPIPQTNHGQTIKRPDRRVRRSGL